MKTNNLALRKMRKRVVSLTALGMLFFICSCNEEISNLSVRLPEIETMEVTDEGSLVYVVECAVSSGDVQIDECGFYCSENDSMQGAEKFLCKLSGSTFTSELSLKGYNRNYYVQAFISNGRTEIRSVIETISVRELSDYVSFGSVTLQSYDRASETARFALAVSFAQGVDVTAFGVLYGTSPDLMDKGTSLALDFSGGESVEFVLEGLKTGTQYYICPFIADDEAKEYGQVQKLNVCSLPSVMIGEVSEITSSSAKVSGAVADNGGAVILEEGIVYAKGQAIPTIENDKTEAFMTSSDFYVTLSGLSPNTLYSARSYARNSEGVSYSSETTAFTTLVSVPSVTTGMNPYNITSSSATLNGSLTDYGGETPSELGFYWSESPFEEPSSALKIAASLSGKSMTTSLSGLARAKTYYYQAFATNSAGTAYGALNSFATLAELPAVETSSVSEITCSGATCGGNVISDGGASVTALGIVWGTSANPEISLCTKTVETSEAGYFTSRLFGLTPGTRYYVRAYATNASGTSYGEETSFTTETLDLSSVTDLSSSGTANCYIVSSSGIYKFKAAKGNNSWALVEKASYCEVLWESFGTLESIFEGDLIKESFFMDDNIIFETNPEFRNGNALIAVKDAQGEILWSWHIWLTDKPQGQVYYNNAGTVMDRNLGATSTKQGDVGSFGLLYQWGRKDPFCYNPQDSFALKRESTASYDWQYSYSKSIVEYSVSHPTTYICLSGYDNDWYGSIGNRRWQTRKTIYDPCPAGWRVPDVDVWSKAVGGRTLFTCSFNLKNDYGGNFSGKLGSSEIWYPVSDIYNYGGTSSGAGLYWSVGTCDCEGNHAYEMRFTDVEVDSHYASLRWSCSSVRCQKE